MTITDYILDIALIAIVVLQVRGRRLTPRSMLLPLGIVAWVVSHYLHGIPTAGNDLVLVAACTALGALLGAGSALFTSVRRDGDGFPVAKAGFVAGALWVAGVGARFAFQLYATHGGGAALGRFSAAHDITSGEAWVAALILMAMAEVVSRTAVLAWRAYDVRRQLQPAFADSSPSAARAIMVSGERSL
jgi:hypothetical protein